MSPKRVRVSLVPLVTVVLLTGCAATIEGNPVGAPAGSAPSTSAPPSSNPAPQPTRPGSTALVNRTVGLAYNLPPDWEEDPNGLNAFSLSGAGSVSPYECEGQRYTRGLVGSTLLPPGDIAQTATILAQELGEAWYGTAGPPQVRAEPPRRIQQAGRSGFVVDATVSSPSNPCLATTGRLTVLVLDSTAELGLFQVFVANVDIEGGPAQPANRTQQELRQIVATVRQAS